MLDILCRSLKEYRGIYHSVAIRTSSLVYAMILRAARVMLLAVNQIYNQPYVQVSVRRRAMERGIVSETWSRVKLLGVDELYHDTCALEPSLLDGGLNMFNQILTHEGEIKLGALFAFPWRVRLDPLVDPADGI